MSHMLPTDRRLAFLDALRGLAAAYVLLYHVHAMPSPPVDAGRIPGMFLETGGSGVALFFVLSAFSLCYTMPRHASTGATWRSFYIHRFFRIAPLFFMWLAFSAWRDGHGIHVGHSIGELLANVTLTFDLFRGWQEGIVWASWAIGVEVIFYAVFPLLFLGIRNMTSATALALSATALTIVIASTDVSNLGPLFVESYGLFRHIPIFIYGVAAYFLYRRMADMTPSASKRLGVLLLVAGAAVFLATACALYAGSLQPSFSWLLFGLSYALILSGMAWRPNRIVVNRLTVYLGRISYSLYLGHPVIIAVLIPVFRHIQNAGIAPGLVYLSCACLTLLVAVPLAHVTYRLVEIPGIALGKRLAPASGRYTGMPATH